MDGAYRRRAGDMAGAQGARSTSLSGFAGSTALALCSLLAACSRGPASDGTRTIRIDRSDVPLSRITAQELQRFRRGDRVFEAVFREADGLGPLYIRDSCSACHREDGRGPGRVGKLVHGVKQTASALPFGSTERPYVAAGASQPVVARAAEQRVTYRFPPAVFGRGYLDAVADAEIERLAAAAAARPGPVRGRIHRVAALGAQATLPTRIGRFGLKARLASLDEFTAEAFQGDMGLTSPLLPFELANPEGLHDDRKPGVDVAAETLADASDYVRLLEIPARAAFSAEGRAAFESALCSVCHVPALRTRADYPVSALAGIEAPVYTDFLLHDMGEGLSDGVSDGQAGPREWRTAPLVGLRFSSAYLHDGRAHDLEAAILAHGEDGSEARAAVDQFRALAPAAREQLLAFVAAL